jgi:GDP-mannose 6-dehydrogenase
VGVDVERTKVDAINAAKSPIVEPDLAQLLQAVVGNGSSDTGSLIATDDGRRAVLETEISMICVGTPSQENGSLDLQHVQRCGREIGRALAEKSEFHLVVARSTMLPGSVEEQLIPEIEYTSRKRAGRDFGVVMNPEFLREGTSIQDFFNPAVTVIGQLDERSGDVLARLYEFLEAPVVRTDIRIAEMVKYANNAFHALKVTFANEIGAVCKALEIDSHSVMDVLCMDSKLNISPYYLRPGFAFGGSCLPKDLRAIGFQAKTSDVAVPLLSAILESNRIHIERATREILRTGRKRIGIVGLSFKTDTDDLRESPLVTLTESLIGKGMDVQIYDANVSLARLFGANKKYIETQIPHIASLMSDNLDAVIGHAELIVVGNAIDGVADALGRRTAGKLVYDLVRIPDSGRGTAEDYRGVCW